MGNRASEYIVNQILKDKFKEEATREVNKVFEDYLLK